MKGKTHAVLSIGLLLLSLLGPARGLRAGQPATTPPPPLAITAPPDGTRQGAAVQYQDASDSDPYVAPQTGAALSATCGGVFTPTADASLYSDEPDTPHGDDSYLRIASSGSYTRTALLAFDLEGSIPSGSLIHSAELVLVLVEPTIPMTLPLQVQGLSEAWSETAVTWNNQPAPGPGFRSRYYYAYSPLAADFSLLTVDVTPLVTLWATGALTETSLALWPGGPPPVAVRAWSRLSDITGREPRLVVRCAPPAGPLSLDAGPLDQRQLAGLGRLRLNALVTPTLTLDDGALRFARFDVAVPAWVKRDGLARAQWFTAAYSDALRLEDPTSELQLVRRSPDDQNIFFRQLHEGIPVFPAELAVHLDGGRVTGVSGGYVPGITLDPTPGLSAEQAEVLALALADPGAQVLGDTQLRYLNLGLIGRPDPTTYLAWEVPLGGGSFFIDAQSGAMLFEQSWTQEGYGLDLHDAKGLVNTCPCYLFWVISDHRCDEEPCPGADADAAAAWWNIDRAWSWWSGAFGRDSYDHDGAEVNAFVHVTFLDDNGNVAPNAAWIGRCQFLGFSNGWPNARDIVGHEFTHAVVNHTANLIYEGQSGALNESLSDIFGNLSEQLGCPDPNPPWCIDWRVGENLPGGPLRDMANPQRDDMGDYLFTAADNGGVHSNCEIHNNAAFLIINGGTFDGHTMPDPLGWDKASWLFYHMLGRLGKNAQFLDARNQAGAVAWDLYSTGFLTQLELCTVFRAYHAVGLGVDDLDCDTYLDDLDPDTDGDGVLNFEDNCPTVPNPGRENHDHDGEGDACDTNDDDDGWLDWEDNCPLVWQQDQNDYIHPNGIGDACDDPDRDRRADAADNCPDAWNPSQEDRNGNGFGDACDPDIDNDGVQDGPDNCDYDYNPGQEDGDGDGYGDVCDLCPTVNSSDNSDPDHDGLANPCDPDDDEDGVHDSGDFDVIEGNHPCTGGRVDLCDDNCRLLENPDQMDVDEDGVGDRCDPSTKEWALEVRDLELAPLRPIKVPLPDSCPACGDGYLSKGYRMGVNVSLGTDFYGQVTASSGIVAALNDSDDETGQVQTFEFSPAPYTFHPFGPGLKANGILIEDLPAAGIRYWLEIVPAPGTSPTETYTLTVEVWGGVPTTIYLPLILRNWVGGP